MKMPIADDDSDEKRIRKVLKSVEMQREKKKADKAKKATNLSLMLLGARIHHQGFLMTVFLFFL